VKTLGKYRLVELLASGGMAEVWRAEVAGPGGFAKEVALKLVREDLARDPAFARMFAEEARLASRLAHANVVHVFEYDVVEGRQLLAMELVRGRTLRQLSDRCRRSGLRLGLPRAVHIGAEVARALAYAHRASGEGAPRGVVHRDVSPQNVLVSFEGEVKLADFGIARALGAVEATAPGTVKGKLGYMAPEQARGEPVDGRADLFALGVVLWELCAGRRLFARDGDAATLAALLSGDPVAPPSQWNEEVPPELDGALLRALERDPSRRLASAAEMEEVLAAVRLRIARGPEDLDLRSLMWRLWPEGPGPSREHEPTRVMGGGDEADAVETRTAPHQVGRLPWAAAAAAGVLLAMGVGLWVARRSSPSIAASTATPTVPLTPALSPAGAGERGTGPPTPTTPPTSTPTTTGSPAGQASPLPRTGGGEGQGEGARRPRSGPIGSLALPARESGEGIVTVNVSPWATLSVDGEAVGDTPREVRLPAGGHQLRAVHPRFGSAEALFEVRSGERRAWRPRLRP
jgi:serine/threonine-protein kinase